MMLACAGCDGGSREQRAIPANSAEARSARQQVFRLDRQAAGSANQVPALEGISGTLGYRPGCLYLDLGAGKQIGLVVPQEVSFDGRQVIGNLGTPQGKPVARQVGQLVSVSGRVIENPGDGSYSCDTEQILIADQF